MKSSQWSVWLMPSIQHNKDYQKMIKFFSNKYSTEVFAPHVTLFGRLSNQPKSYFPFFQEISYKQNPITMKILDIEKGVPPWKSLYIRLHLDSNVQKFQDSINKKLEKIRYYDFSPHLSLAYGNISVNKDDLNKIALCKIIQFSSLALIYTPDQINRWELIKRFNFKTI
tara:strand:- start:1078 stop:1584 length:507 start_codon:yes stop_codon:yes gene_type:complete